MSSIDGIRRHHWFGDLTVGTIGTIGAEIKRRLENEKHILIIIDDPANSQLEIYNDQRLKDEYVYDYYDVRYSELKLEFTDRRIFLQARANNAAHYYEVAFDGAEIKITRTFPDGSRPMRIYIQAFELQEDIENAT